MTLLSAPRSGSRWVPLSVLLGLGLAILLLINSISTYRLVSQRLAVEQVRRDLSLRIATLENSLRNVGMNESAETVLEELRRNSAGRIVWIHLRDGSGRVVANAGLDAEPAFPADVLRAQFRNHQPVFTTAVSDAGTLVVEAFPLRLPHASPQSLVRLAVNSTASEAPGKSA